MQDVKETLKKIKALFADPSIPQVTPPAPVPPVMGDQELSVGWNVDGGTPIYVNAPEDEMADIDINTPVYSDAALTIPYPDGSFTIAGTKVVVTIQGGKASSVEDSEGKGLGEPNAVAVDAKCAPNQMDAAQFNEFKTAFDGFRTEFGSVKTAFEAHQVAFAEQKAAFAEAKQTIINQQNAITQMLGVIEKLATVPTADPINPPL